MINMRDESGSFYQIATEEATVVRDKHLEIDAAIDRISIVLEKLKSLEMRITTGSIPPSQIETRKEFVSLNEFLSRSPKVINELCDNMVKVIDMIEEQLF